MPASVLCTVFRLMFSSFLPTSLPSNLSCENENMPQSSLVCSSHTSSSLWPDCCRELAVRNAQYSEELLEGFECKRRKKMLLNPAILHRIPINIQGGSKDQARLLSSELAERHILTGQKLIFCQLRLSLRQLDFHSLSMILSAVGFAAVSTHSKTRFTAISTRLHYALKAVVSSITTKLSVPDG